jgi:predicted MPP superfamily phosphohydrolase
VFAVTASALGLKRRRYRLSLLVLVLLMPLLFPAAWILHYSRPGPLPGALHAVSSFWLAGMLHLSLCLAAVFTAAGLARLFGRRPSARPLVFMALASATALTLFGFVNAKFPSVTPVHVGIHGLPQQWRERTIVQLSDVHLGVVHGTSFLDRLVAKVNALNPDLVLITGDLFDGLGYDCNRFVPGLNRLRSRMGVFCVTGNHEGYLGVNRALAALARTGIRVLDGRAVQIDGLQLVGIGYRLFDRPGDAARRAFTAEGGFRAGLPTILLYHTPTSLETDYATMREQQVTTYFAPRLDFGLAREMGVGLQLSGHTHGGQTFPFAWWTRRLFGGYHRGLHVLGDFSIYISPGTGTWGPPIRVGQRSEITVIRLR